MSEMTSSRIIWTVLLVVLSCGPQPDNQQSVPTNESDQRGQSAVIDSESEKNILQVAIASPDHTILASALKAAGYEDAICNCGPFTLFAPTDDAFERLPKDQLPALLKPENRNALREVLEHHVYIGVISPDMIRDGMVLGLVDGKKVTLTKEGQITRVGKARILDARPVSNGIIYNIDEVLLPE